MPLLYTFDLDSTADVLAILAGNLQQRRLERGLSRATLSQMSGVPVATISKFEQKHSISLASFVALARALGYKDGVKALLDTPLYSTMDELQTIHKNKNRKRGGRSDAGNR